MDVNSYCNPQTPIQSEDDRVKFLPSDAHEPVAPRSKHLYWVAGGKTMEPLLLPAG